jgi:hypothetical protein
MALLRIYPAAFVSGTHTWTNSANLVGNTTTFATHAATFTIGTVLGARMRYDMSVIPNDAQINSVTAWLAGKVSVAARNFTGVTIRHQNANAPVTVTATAQAMATTDGTYGIVIPWATLEAAGWTLAMLQDSTNTVEFTLTTSATSTTTTSLQKLYLDVDYTLEGMKSLKLFPSVRHVTTGEYSNVVNVLGDTNLEASKLSATTTDYPVLRVGFDLATLPENAASIESITWAVQARSSTTLKRRTNQVDLYAGGAIRFMKGWDELITAVNTNGPEWLFYTLPKAQMSAGMTPANFRTWNTAAEWTLTTTSVDTASVTNYVRRMYLIIDYTEATEGASPLFGQNF